MVRDAPGKAVVYVPLKQQDQAFLLPRAAAVVFVKRAWGWDESERIDVLYETTGGVLSRKIPGVRMDDLK